MGQKKCRCGQEHPFHLDVRSHTHVAMERKLTPVQQLALRNHVQTKANDAAYEWLCMTQPDTTVESGPTFKKPWWRFGR